MEHPITPPPELVRQWTDMWYTTNDKGSFSVYFSTMAAQWGADQELEACCAWLDSKGSPNASRLRIARRPKPPSLKKQAQVELDYLVALISTEGALAMAEPIRRALEALPND